MSGTPSAFCQRSSTSTLTQRLSFSSPTTVPTNMDVAPVRCASGIVAGAAQSAATGAVTSPGARSAASEIVKAAAPIRARAARRAVDPGPRIGPPRAALS